MGNAVPIVRRGDLLVDRFSPQYAWIRLILASLTAAVNLYSLVIQNQKLAIDSADLHEQWNRLGMDYARLWENMYGDDSPERLNSLDDRSVELSRSRTSLPNKRQLMHRWQKHVLQQRGLKA